MPNAVIVDAFRTPARAPQRQAEGRAPGRPRRASCSREIVERNDLDPALVDDVIMGCVMQVGEQGLNIGRNAALAAGFPETTVGTTIDRQCGSSQQAAHFAAQGVIAGAYDVVIAAGVEIMTARADGRVDRRRQVRLPVRPDDDRPLPQPRAAGHLGRADRREVGHHPRGDRRVRGRSRSSVPRRPPKRAASSARSCRSTITTEDGEETMTARRGHPPRHQRREARHPQARLQGRRRDHRRQLVADHRRRGRGARS